MADYNSFQENFARFILSASGFRKVFAAENSKDTPEESLSPEISSEDKTATAIIADIFGKLVSEREGKTIAVGTDARPTGPRIAEVIIKTLSDLGFKIRYSGITAAPELMAWVKTDPEVDGFAYISASHNPIGHNGFKFGFSDGAVIGGETAKRFISMVIAAAVDVDYFNKYAGTKISGTLPDSSAWKQKAATAYRNFSDEVISAATDPQSREKVLFAVKKAASGIGIVAELNGSARGTSIDRSYFESFGMKTRFINSIPGQIVHRIVPEGSSLDMCRSELEKGSYRRQQFHPWLCSGQRRRPRQHRLY